MTIQGREQALFNRWRSGRSKFLPDGVVDERSYKRSKLRLLFVLKEANDERFEDAWDLREWLQKGGQAATWSAVARWARGIGRLPLETSWDTVAAPTAVDRQSWLCDIAAMNLKKRPGGKSTVNEELEKAVEEDSRFIREQIGIYDADLVICCGSIVAELVCEVLYDSSNVAWLSTTRGVQYLEHQPGKHLVNWFHPQARFPQQLMFYGLIDAVREIRHSSSSG